MSRWFWICVCAVVFLWGIAAIIVTLAVTS